MLNSQLSTGKITTIERRLNFLLISLFVCQIVICTVMAILANNMEETLSVTTNYLNWGGYKPSGKNFIKNFMMFFIDESSIIPVSLIVSIEIAKLAQSYFIDFDKLMYSDIKERGVLATK
jgi:magnesium-transporting ATPase (P-type)